MVTEITADDVLTIENKILEVADLISAKHPEKIDPLDFFYFFACVFLNMLYKSAPSVGVADNLIENARVIVRGNCLSKKESST